MRKNDSNSSIFQLFCKKDFKQLVAKWEMDKGVRTFTTWEMTCALITCMTLKIGSLREAEQTLGIPRSTFSDAMTERSYGFFFDLCDGILAQILLKTQKRKVKKVIRQILAIDASECRVHGSLFTLSGWKQPKSHGHSSSCKLHVAYNVDGQWVENFLVTGVKKSDSRTGRYFELQSNKIYVFDRAYNELSLWRNIVSVQSHFVTRLKDSKNQRKLLRKILLADPEKNGVLYDGIYTPTVATLYKHNEVENTLKIRHIIYRDPDSDKIFHFATSDFKISGQEVADTYRKRWAVELLFRWLKGHLNIRYLPVKSSNAVKIQLAVSVLIQLLIQLQKTIQHFSGTQWQLLRRIRTLAIRKGLVNTSVPVGCRWRSRSRANFENHFF